MKKNFIFIVLMSVFFEIIFILQILYQINMFSIVNLSNNSFTIKNNDSIDEQIITEAFLNAYEDIGIEIVTVNYPSNINRSLDYISKYSFLSNNINKNEDKNVYYFSTENNYYSGRTYWMYGDINRENIIKYFEQYNIELDFTTDNNIAILYTVEMEYTFKLLLISIGVIIFYMVNNCIVNASEIIKLDRKKYILLWGIYNIILSIFCRRVLQLKNGYFLKSIIILNVVILLTLGLIFLIYSLHKKKKDSSNNKSTFTVLLKIFVNTLLFITLSITLISNSKNIISIINDKEFIEKNYDETFNNYYTYKVYVKEPDDIAYMYNLGLEIKNLYKLNDKTIIMQPDSNLVYDLNIDSIENEFFWRNNGVRINNNYLKINTIVDENNSVVDLSMHENDDVLILLVPEKYKSYEAEIKKDFQETYLIYRYADEDYYITRVLDQNPPERKPTEIVIKYVKNNQKYSYVNMEHKIISGENGIMDPIGIVVNKVNMGGDFYMAALSQENMLFNKTSNNISVTLKRNISKENSVGEKYCDYIEYYRTEITVRCLCNTYILFCIIVLMCNKSKINKQRNI